MASIQDRNKLKRVSHDTWSTREQLCLASSVLKAGDQNWVSVSRSLKPFAEKEALRPPDWFSQKSCAVQYSILIENADAPKRKKRESGETTGESIVRRLTQERIAELGQILAFQRDEYQQLKAEVNLLQSGMVTEEKLQKMWQSIEQEERDQEQKARAHAAWLAKRQQKQEVQPPVQTITLASPRKSLEPIDTQETSEISNEEEEKKNRGGRSPLLTSLLKSPSPTTQMQTPTSSVQTSSPTIASLLGSSPKVPSSQIPTSIPQLHQLVSNSVANAVVERPSVGAPTLSMLLELPANSQRASLANLQQVQQQISSPEVHMQTAKQPLSQNETQRATSIQPGITVSEGMVQIIDQVDDAIAKDIMADVINKDEINEIIGDLEELIKEEITGSPQNAKPVQSIPIVENPITEVEKVVPERPEPRDVDEAVSLSNSPQSEIAIEDIDQSTSSIAEIIGTVAIEPIEQKITVASAVVEKYCESEEKEQPKEEQKRIEDVREWTKTEKVESKLSEEDDEAKLEKTSIGKNDVEEEKVEEELKKEEDTIVDGESKVIDKIELSSGEIPTEKSLEKPSGIVAEETSETGSTVEEEKETTCVKKDQEECKEKNDDLDQIEMNLAKITGDQNEVSSAEVVSVCSEVTTEAPSVEDTEKSQDISMILEDDESSQSNLSKKKDPDEQSLIENLIDGSDSQESFKEGNTTKEETAKGATYENSTDVDSPQEAITEKIEIEEKFDDPKDASAEDCVTLENVKEDTVEENSVSKTEEESHENTDVKDVKEEKEEKEPKEQKIDEEDILPKLDPDNDEEKSTVPLPMEDNIIIKVEPDEEVMKPEVVSKIEEIELKREKEEEKSEDEPTIKKESVESSGSICDDIGDLDEEESSLKLSGGRAMKTYSKKQTIAVDSEPENESSGENADYRAWKKAVMLVYNRLATHKYASVFLRPITEDQAPGYHSVIFRPMDLSTIKKNIDNGTIRSTMHFQRDVMLMFQNAIMYNKQDTFVYKMAVSMQEECLQHMQILVQVTGEGQLRRETRTAASSSSEMDSSIKRKRSHITPSPHDTDNSRGKKRRRSEND